MADPCSDGILGAAIGAAGALGAATIALFTPFAQHLANWLARRLPQPPTTPAPPVVLFSAERIEVTVTFDEHGSGTNERKWIGLRANQNIERLTIPYRFSVKAPDASAEKPDIEELDGAAFPASFIGKEGGPQLVVGDIVLLGVMLPGIRYTGFVLHQKFERATLMTRKEVQQAYAGDTWQTEYAAASIVLTTGTLQVLVHFPPSFRGKNLRLGVVVFKGLTEDLDVAEVSRVRAGLSPSDDGESASLTVTSPKEGNRYGIAWMPPI